VTACKAGQKRSGTKCVSDGTGSGSGGINPSAQIAANPVQPITPPPAIDANPAGPGFVPDPDTGALPDAKRTMDKSISDLATNPLDLPEDSTSDPSSTD
jgi:hypothetical protein